MSESSNRTFSRGRGGRNRGRTPSTTSMSGSWRAAGGTAGDSVPANTTPVPAAPPAASKPAPAAAAATPAAQPRPRANSQRKAPSRAPSFSAAPPPPITVTAPAPTQPAAPTAAAPATPKSNKKGGRSRKASAASSTLAPIASSSTPLAPIASAPPNTTGFGSKASIDSLVQHIRANAIDHSGKGDWAQDNDDSLPDLDDWDIDSKSNASGASNVLVVKDIPSSIKTAPVAMQGLAAQQKLAKDKLADVKKSRRGGKGKNKGADASPISPKQPSPSVPSHAIPHTHTAFTPTTAPSHPLAAAVPPPRALPQQVAVQLPKAVTKLATDRSPTGHSPLLPSPVFATLNPPFSASSSSVRKPNQHSRGDTKNRDSTRSGALSASASKKVHPPHPLASNSVGLRAVNEEILSASSVTKPASPIEFDHAKSVVKLPSPTGAEGSSSSSLPPSKASQDTSPPSTPKTGGGIGLPGSHRRTPSNQSQTSAPHSPRQRPGPHHDARDAFTASHARNYSSSRPKISVSALFQLNRSLAGNPMPSSKGSPSPAVA